MMLSALLEKRTTLISGILTALICFHVKLNSTVIRISYRLFRDLSLSFHPGKQTLVARLLDLFLFFAGHVRYLVSVQLDHHLHRSPFPPSACSLRPA